MTNIPVSERALWVGASESAALFGVSPYTTKFELYHQKQGNIPSPDLSTDERVNAGQFLEPSIAEWAGHKWHWPILHVDNYRAHPEVQRMGASLDFEAVDGLEPVEIKNVDNLIFRDGDWEHDGDVIKDAPAHMLIQVQHQIACTPRDRKLPERGWLVVCVGGNKLYRMEVPRHDGMIARIENEVKDFWYSIACNAAPDPKFDLDVEAISLLYGGTGEDFADLRGDERALELANLYKEHLAIEKQGREGKQAAMAELKTMMQDARGALIDDHFKITTSHVEESTSVRKAHWRFNLRQSKPKE